MNELDVMFMQPDDYVVAEFRELSELDFTSEWDIAMPTGRTYVLEGPLKEYNGFLNVNEKGLSMPNGQSVRQTDGSPGGNLVQILSYIPKEPAND